jgi:hypothetical protein
VMPVAVILPGRVRGAVSIITSHAGRIDRGVLYSFGP